MSLLRSWRLRAAAAAIVALLATGTLVVVLERAHPAPRASPRAARPVPASPSPSLTESVHPVSRPARLLVPSIGVDAVIEAVGTDSHDRMAAPSTSDHVGWYEPGPVPGAPGDAVLDGHLDWYDTPHAVFWRLGQLQIGDEMTVVMADGSQVRFAVFSSTTYPYDAHPPGLFATGGRPSLALITCAGSWDHREGTYLQRLVVLAAPVVSAQGSPPPVAGE